MNYVKFTTDDYNNFHELTTDYNIKEFQMYVLTGDCQFEFPYIKFCMEYIKRKYKITNFKIDFK